MPHNWNGNPKKSYYTIAEASKITGLTIHTIRYWIEINVIKIPKNPDNGYYMFNNDAIEDLINLARHRDVGIPLNFDTHKLGREDWLAIYKTALSKRNQERRKIDRQIAQIQACIAEINEVTAFKKEPSPKPDTINFRKLIKYDNNNPKILKLLSSAFVPIVTFVKINDDFSFNSTMCIDVPPDFDSGEIIWSFNESDVFYSTLIKRSLVDNSENTNDILQALQSDGLKPIYFIVYGLLSDSKEKVEYFKAYIKVDKVLRN